MVASYVLDLRVCIMFTATLGDAAIHSDRQPKLVLGSDDIGKVRRNSKFRFCKEPVTIRKMMYQV